MAKAYYGTKISNNISKTPEGFLICHNVPIARIGHQDYLPEEIGVEGNKPIKVYRSPEEVFAIATIASAEGKDVTDLHPSQWVNTNNHSAFSKGHAQNVIHDENFLYADLFIKDAVLINKIENGQREVSCGYDCDYVETENGYEQKNIRINHIAVVPNGRAGKEVAIRDSKPTVKTKEKAKMSKGNLFGRMLKAFAQDAEPEEVAEAAELIKSKEEPEEKGKAVDNEHSEVMKSIVDSLEEIKGRLSKLETAEAAEPEETAIDALEKELEKGCKEEDAELVPAVVLSEEEKPKNPIPGADAALAMLRSMKPVIAAMPQEHRQKATDALLASVRGMIPSGEQKTSYADLTKAKAADAKAEDGGDLGKTIKAKFHRKPITK